MLKAELEIENKALLEENARMKRTLLNRTSISLENHNKLLQAEQAKVELMRESKDNLLKELESRRVLCEKLLLNIHDIDKLCNCGAFEHVMDTSPANPPIIIQTL